MQGRCLGAILSMSLLLVACGGGGESATPEPTNMPSVVPPPVPPVVSSSKIEGKVDAYRFLAFAGFGGSDRSLEAMVDTDAADWLAAQFAKPYDSYLDRVLDTLPPLDDTDFSARVSERRLQLDMFWDAAMSGDDILRQRVLFALSQIIVANDRTQSYSHQEAYYLDNLGKHAFGNYKDILRDITYTPLMGRYLTYVNNRKADPSSGRLPDENFAREILQLFSIGLVELQMNGEPRLRNGEPIETYDNDDVMNLARVFTGLQYDRSEPGATAWVKPMMMNDERHSTSEKRFLSIVIPADTDGETTIALALDEIFSHPNVAPFISRQLIQRFTSSSPTPAYVERVATAFETGWFVADNDVEFGTGERGDLEATVAAILLDASLFDDATIAGANVGKIREPVLRFAHWGRAFKLGNVKSSAESSLRFTESPSVALGQRPFGSSSVFNFYRPGFVAPGSESAEQGLTAPEFQIVNTGSAIGFSNFMTNYIRDITQNDGSNSYLPDYSDELALADDAAALVDHLALLLTGHQISEASKTAITNAVETIGIRVDQEDTDRQARVRLAIIMFVNDPSFTVIK